jgi:prevent-host-death family protein
MQVQLAEMKNKMSEYVRAVQAGATFEITVRGVPVAQLTAMPSAPAKTGFATRVLAFMDSPHAPKFDVNAALLEGRK